MLLRAAPPEPARLSLVRLAHDVVLGLVPEHGTSRGLGSMRPVPYGTVAVTVADSSDGDGDSSRTLRVAAMRMPGEPLEDYQTVDIEADQLTSGLDLPSRRRLISFLLGFCGSAFHIGAVPSFAATCRRLIEEAYPCRGFATPVAQLPHGLIVLRDASMPAGSVLYGVGHETAFTSRFHGLGSSSPHFSGLQVIETMPEDALVLADGDGGGFWRVRQADDDLPHLLSLLGRRGKEASELREAVLLALAPRAALGGAEARLMREIQTISPVSVRVHSNPEMPIGGAVEIALPDASGGLFLKGWIHDPLAMIQSVHLLTAAGSSAVSDTALHRLRRPDLAGILSKFAYRASDTCPGFLAHVPDPSAGTTPQPQLLLRLHSGAPVVLTPPARSLPPAGARDAVLGSVEPGSLSPETFSGCIVPAARALHEQAMKTPNELKVIEIGIPVRAPAVSLLIPVYRNLGFIRYQLATFAADPDFEDYEVVMVLDSPEQAHEFEHLLRGLHLLHALPVRLVVMARNMGFAAATNAAAAHARAPVFMMLNSDVVPTHPGWISNLLAAVSNPEVGAAGPKMMFDDESLQHAGLFFERGSDGQWFNRHYHKGRPRHWPAASIDRLVPAVTGGALMLRASTFWSVGGMDQDYIIGDYEDSDLCLKIQTAGQVIRYVPSAELYHFERRSISLHRGYSKTLASSYNRRLHHERWDSDIEGVMRAQCSADRNQG